MLTQAFLTFFTVGMYSDCEILTKNKKLMGSVYLLYQMCNNILCGLRSYFVYNYKTVIAYLTITNKEGICNGYFW